MHCGLILLAILIVSSIDGFYSQVANPLQVHISYAGKNQMLVQWVSSSANDFSSVLYGTSPNSLTFISSGTATAYTFQGYTSGGIHSVVLSQLNYSQMYYYQVGAPGMWSDTYNFNMAPPPGTGNIKIGITGDVGVTSFSQLTIKGLISVRTNNTLDFILHAGDLSYADDFNPGGPIWDNYGSLIEPLVAYTPYQPTVGNHESINSFTGYKLRYGTSILEKNSLGGDFYWSFDWGFVHVIMLSSESDFTPTSPQSAWLMKDLVNIDRTVTPWVIAISHRPWYSSSTPHDDVGNQMRMSLENLINQYKVDLYLAGHVHSYERIGKVYNLERNRNGNDYLVVGNGGTPEGLTPGWVFPDPAWSVFRIAQWGYGYLHLVNGTHALWTMYLDVEGSEGIIMDQAWIIRQYPR